MQKLTFRDMEHDILTVEETIMCLRKQFSESEDPKTATLILKLMDVKDHLYHLCDFEKEPVIDLDKKS